MILKYSYVNTRGFLLVFASNKENKCDKHDDGRLWIVLSMCSWIMQTNQMIIHLSPCLVNYSQQFFSDSDAATGIITVHPYINTSQTWRLNADGITQAHEDEQVFNVSKLMIVTITTLMLLPALAQSQRGFVQIDVLSNQHSCLLRLSASVTLLMSKLET